MFASVGQVSSVSLVRDRATGQSRGFAFVEMADAQGRRRAPGSARVRWPPSDGQRSEATGTTQQQRRQLQRSPSTPRIALVAPWVSRTRHWRVLAAAGRRVRIDAEILRSWLRNAVVRTCSHPIPTRPRGVATPRPSLCSPPAREAYSTATTGGEMAISTRRLCSIGVLAAVALLVGGMWGWQRAAAQGGAFHLEEATIADVHRAIQQAQITCRDLVRAYIDRARIQRRERSPRHRRWRPDPGVSRHVPRRCSAAIPNADGRRVHPAARLWSICGTANRARTDGGDGIGSGRAAAVRNDGGHARQQSNQRARHPNIRGERSVACKGDRDRHPSQGALPRLARRVRGVPEAARCARARRGLDAQYGNNPDLTAMPMCCIPFSFKDPFDTKDMRSTAAADARYDIDFPARDHTLVAQLRRTGAIIYAKAVNTEYNGIPADPGGRHGPEKIIVSDLGYQRSSGRATRTAPTTRRARRRSARARARARR